MFEPLMFEPLQETEPMMPNADSGTRAGAV